MMRSKSSFTGIIFASLLLVMVLLSCSAPPATSTPAATAKPAGPKYGGTLHLAMQAPPQHIDTILQTGQHANAMAKLYGNTLIRFGGKDADSLTLEPALAKSWEVSPDGMMVTFKLQEGVKWQNIPPVNGREFTAEDAKFSASRIMDVKTRSPLRPYMEPVDRIEVIDKYTVRYYLKYPDPATVSNMCGSGSNVYAREVIEKDGNAGKTVIGTGPFIYVPEEEVANSRYIFKRNPDYWEKGKPYLDRIELNVMPEEQAQLAAFRAGQLDQLLATKTTLDSIQSTVKNVGIAFPVETLGNALVFGVRQNPKLWGDVRVRKAVMYALDIEGLIKAVVNGAGRRSMWIAPYFKEWGAAQPEQMWKRDVAKSKALLAEAGYPNGFKTEIMQHLFRMEAWGGTTEPITAMLKDVGIDATIKPTEHVDYTAKIRDGAFELAPSVGTFASPLDPDSALFQMYRSNGPYNRAGYNNPKVDKLIDDQKKAYGDPEARKVIVKQILATLDEDIPVVPLYYQWKWHVTQPWIKGWENAGDGNSQLGFNWVYGVWLDK